MAIVLKCKMCGGDLNVEPGEKIVRCEFCDTQQTVPNADIEKKINLFNRANSLRSVSEFDRAAGIYESIINEFPDEAEAYWGIVLCKYGIEYVDDPATGKKVPTCHRTSYESIFNDINYKQAVDLADTVAKDLYKNEAEYISNIQKGILEIAKNEKPFDIFICYKESDGEKRTQDSVIAQDLYYQLTNAGFKVFFSRITLEDKLGSAYEPYIFAALNSSKVMIVVGTKPEYYNAVWVKNEWSRFLDIMKKDNTKTIIPAYRDMNPYDLPDALSMFQAQDMSKLGFMQDIIHGIKKIISKEEKPKAQPTATPMEPETKLNTENLLKRGYLALEDRNWDIAADFFERVLDENAEEPRAYLGKLLIELKCTSVDKLEQNKTEIENYDNYKKALRFASGGLRVRLQDYASLVYYNRTNWVNDIDYNNPTYEMPSKIKKAMDDLRLIKNFRDSGKRLENCSNALNIILKLLCNKKVEEVKRKINFDCYQNAMKMYESYERDFHYTYANDVKSELKDWIYNTSIDIIDDAENKEMEQIIEAEKILEYLGDYKQSEEYHTKAVNEKEKVIIYTECKAKASNFEKRRILDILISDANDIDELNLLIFRLQNLVNYRDSKLLYSEAVKEKKDIYKIPLKLGMKIIVIPIVLFIVIGLFESILWHIFSITIFLDFFIIISTVPVLICPIPGIILIIIGIIKFILCSKKIDKKLMINNKINKIQ